MSDFDTVEQLLPNITLTAVIVANGVPVVGLLAFNMSGLGLVVFYWIEFTILSLWALLRGLFAGMPPEPDDEQPAFGTTYRLTDWGNAGISIPETDVKILYRTLPGLVFLIPFLGALWVGFGGFVAGPVITANPEAELPVWVIVGAATVVITEGWRTGIEYFYRGGYRQTTVWIALRGVLLEGFVLVVAGLLVLTFANELADSRTINIETAARRPLILAAIIIKFSIDLARYHLERHD
jgi:hypothetical protein